MHICVNHILKWFRDKSLHLIGLELPILLSCGMNIGGKKKKRYCLRLY